MYIQRALASAPRGPFVACLGAWTVVLLVGQLVVSPLTGSPVRVPVVVASLVVWVGIAVWGALPRRRMSHSEAAVALCLGSVAITVDAVGSRIPGLPHLVSVGLVGFVLAVGTLSRGRWVLAADAIILCCQALVVGAAVGPGLLGVYVTVATTVTTAGACLAIWSLQGTLRARAASSQVVAQLDPLTGLLNRRGLAERFRPLRDSAADGQRAAAVVMDLDHFKGINDVHGHDAGDKVLVAVADALRRCGRSDDLLVRLGGEEFAWVGLWSSPEAAFSAAERLRAAVPATPMSAALRVTTSIGVAFSTDATQTSPADEALSRLLVRADSALYEAKRAGRDRVVMAPPQLPGSPNPHHDRAPVPRLRDGGLRAEPPGGSGATGAPPLGQRA